MDAEPSVGSPTGGVDQPADPKASGSRATTNPQDDDLLGRLRLLEDFRRVHLSAFETLLKTLNSTRKDLRNAQLDLVACRSQIEELEKRLARLESEEARINAGHKLDEQLDDFKQQLASIEDSNVRLDTRLTDAVSRWDARLSRLVEQHNVRNQALPSRPMDLQPDPVQHRAGDVAVVEGSSSSVGTAVPTLSYQDHERLYQLACQLAKDPEIDDTPQSVPASNQNVATTSIPALEDRLAPRPTALQEEAKDEKASSDGTKIATTSSDHVLCGKRKSEPTLEAVSETTGDERRTQRQKRGRTSRQDARSDVDTSDARSEYAPSVESGECSRSEYRSYSNAGDKNEVLVREPGKGQRDRSSTEDQRKVHQPSTLRHLRQIDYLPYQLSDSNIYYMFARLGKMEALSPILVSEDPLIKVSLVSEDFADMLVKNGHAEREPVVDKFDDRWVRIDLSWPFDTGRAPRTKDGFPAIFEAEGIRFLVVPRNEMQRGIVFGRADLDARNLQVSFRAHNSRHYLALDGDSHHGAIYLLIHFSNAVNLRQHTPFRQICRIAEIIAGKKDTAARVEAFRLLREQIDRRDRNKRGPVRNTA